ncbi:MAG: carboxy-S-adenosyl-L-methionine synthase CmoA [Polyangiaceae bacterium]|nr:carboxy-S-adenosyl-L-methionine synthase CmoA [Polyangiaceae bacterium]
MDGPSEKDEIFKEKDAARGSFSFDEQVARVFPDMLRRSIPGYRQLLQLLGLLAHQRVSEGGHVYDLGCSLGAVSLAIRHAIGNRGARIIGVDNSPAMIARCRAIMDADSGQTEVELIEADIASTSVSNASLIVLNFTLQFIAPEERSSLLQRLAAGLNPGGALVISEKVAAPLPEQELFFRDLHDAFRRENGYSQIELSRKRNALEKVLVPAEEETIRQDLERAGLRVIPWFRALQFVSWVAIQ